MTYLEAQEAAQAEAPEGWTLRRIYLTEENAWEAVYGAPEEVYDVRKGRMVLPVRRETVGYL